MPKTIFAVGGTGGHIFPAIELAKKLDGETLFVGEKNPFSGEVPYIQISSATPFSKNPFRILRALCKLGKGFFQSRALLIKERPQLVIGFGSFHAFPTLLAANSLRIPIALFESNSVMGRANRFFLRSAKAIFSPFEFTETATRLITLTSHFPDVSKETALSYYSFDPEKTTLLIFGGSQGALPINSLILHALPNLPSDRIQVIHCIGKNADLEEFKRAYKDLGISAVVKVFEKKMEMAWSAADLAICRSGANTIAEILHFEVPAVLIPYPYATDAHQAENALYIEEVVGGGMAIAQKDLTGHNLAHLICEKMESDISLWKEAIVRYNRDVDRPNFGEAVRKLLCTIS
jgi:UDP-N-acetylglucosamine--N-acetylmuramyl-(pentapeptide) pyrophosphoryl-undecaprenol N-acetylglucosamine transferase